MKLHDLIFIGGPACGKRVRVAKVHETYEHHHNGEVHIYDVLAGIGKARAMHAGVLEVR